MAGFLSFTQTSVSLSGVLSFADPRRSIEAIDLSVKVNGFVHLLVELKEEVFHDRPGFPGNLVIVPIWRFNPDGVYAS